jgi:hypothetical protein
MIQMVRLFQYGADDAVSFRIDFAVQFRANSNMKG